MRALSSFALRALILCLILAVLASIAKGDVGCLDGCSSQLAQCTNSEGGPENCEDQYEKCVDDCLNRQ